jgi:hypothetical protein
MIDNSRGLTISSLTSDFELLESFKSSIITTTKSPNITKKKNHIVKNLGNQNRLKNTGFEHKI